MANKVAEVIGYEGKIIWDSSKPDGTPRKLMDSSRLFHTGWRPKIHLSQGIKMAYNDFLSKLIARNQETLNTLSQLHDSLQRRK